MKLSRTVAFVLAALLCSANEGLAQPQPVTGGQVQIAQATYLQVAAALEQSGYRVTEIKSTLLGRIRIRAQNRDHEREIVVSRSTGEIKRDIVVRMLASDSDEEVRPGRSRESQRAVLERGGGGNDNGGSGNQSVGGGGNGRSGGVNQGGGSDASNGGNVSVGGAGVSVDVGSGGVSLGFGG